jgi:hypothetical protein
MLVLVRTLGSKSVYINESAEAPYESTTAPDVCYNCARPPAGWSVDDDGIYDRLEYDLAHRFFPNIEMHTHPDMYEAYVYTNNAIPYTVEPVDSINACSYDETDPNDGPKCLEIRFGIAYHYDFGAPFGINDHTGDSEFYAALVRRTTSWASAKANADDWLMFADFTAAHWGEGFFDKSKVETYSVHHASAVTVHASQHKHALYHSRLDCSLALEDCLQWGGYNMRSDKTGKLQNVGNFDSHDAVDTSIRYPDSDFGGYRIWDGEPFGSASAYLSHFTADISWTIPGSFTGGGGGGDSDRPPTHEK